MKPQYKGLIEDQFFLYLNALIGETNPKAIALLNDLILDCIKQLGE